MESSIEAYRLIVNQVGRRGDLCTLCRVNKGFRQAAEQALYNTIYASDASETFMACSLFARNPRLAMIVETLTLCVGDGGGSETHSEPCLPEGFWKTVSSALRRTTQLRFLNLHLSPSGDTAQAWILNGTTFPVRSFYCDLQWDSDLVSFLNTQPDIDDLYIIDYCVPTGGPTTSATSPLDAGALPHLSTLECTFAEAACALLPSRPISRLKTCFSKTRLQEKREELFLLCSRLLQTTRPLRSLDIGDASYCESFSIELLSSVVNLQNHVQDLRYLGTLVLPVDGRIRLKFYGLLRRLSSLECVEVDVTDWDPPPSIPAGLRALACELRLYCPSLQRVIFVNDFERTSIAVTRGICDLDCDTDTDNIWREL